MPDKRNKYNVEFINSSDQFLEALYFDDHKDDCYRSWKIPKAVVEELISWHKKLKQDKEIKYPIKEKTKNCEFSMNTEKNIEIKEFDCMGRYKMIRWSLPREVAEELVRWDEKNKEGCFYKRPSH